MFDQFSALLKCAGTERYCYDRRCKGKTLFSRKWHKRTITEAWQYWKSNTDCECFPSTGINWNKMICSINWIVTIIYTCFMFNPGDGEMFSVDFHFYFRDSKSRRDSCWELTPVLLHSRVLHPLLQNLKYK